MYLFFFHSKEAEHRYSIIGYSIHSFLCIQEGFLQLDHIKVARRVSKITTYSSRFFVIIIWSGFHIFSRFFFCFVSNCNFPIICVNKKSKISLLNSSTSGKIKIMHCQKDIILENFVLRCSSCSTIILITNIFCTWEK